MTEGELDVFLASSIADARMAARGVPLADFEDRDGRLPHEKEAPAAPTPTEAPAGAQKGS